ncbi:unnamed protein product [Nippostrongylus brasiliensis]|uniref:Astacin domain-containing protein n=1 Tax=Nippostrongylus brasiliensis TaxID=27835 RepID=A0A0N4YFM5_NIPBR|nr:unnamed protein product [Nippostrongylus brasiliensis]
MTTIAIALMFLVDIAVGLSPEAKESLTHAMPGVDLEALRERLRRIGEHSLPAKNETAPENADNSPTVDLDAPGIETINAREGVVEYLYQGDMILSEAQLKELEGSLDANNSTRRKRQWTNSDSARWPDNHLFYSFAASVSAKTKSIVKQSVAYLQARSCLTFTEDAAAADRVEVFTGSGCYSSLGFAATVAVVSMGMALGAVRARCWDSRVNFRRHHPSLSMLMEVYIGLGYCDGRSIEFNMSPSHQSFMICVFLRLMRSTIFLPALCSSQSIVSASAKMTMSSAT